MLLETSILLSTPYFLKVQLYPSAPSLISILRHVAEPGDHSFNVQACPSWLLWKLFRGLFAPPNIHLPSELGLSGPHATSAQNVSLNWRKLEEHFKSISTWSLTTASCRECHLCNDSTTQDCYYYTHTHLHQHPVCALAPRPTDAAWCCCVKLSLWDLFLGKPSCSMHTSWHIAYALNTKSN